MNYLALAQRTARECGVSGSGPATVIGNQGELSRIVNWVASAWDDIQMAFMDWRWMTSSFTLTLTAGDNEYTPTDAGIVTRFGMWDVQSFRIYQISVDDELPLPFINYEDFRSLYLTGARPQQRPMHFTVAPNMNILVGYKPDMTYTVTGDYFKSNQSLVIDADTPEMPAQFHMAIVYRAMMMYARYNSAPEIYDDAEANYKRIITRLQLNQTPDVTVSAPLV